MTRTNYTFGDNDEASLRLRNLANLYEPDTRSLLKRSEVDRPRLAIDLGCGDCLTLFDRHALSQIARLIHVAS